MNRAAKRLDGMRRNPHGDWTIKDVQSVCDDEGINCTAPTRGDHYKISHSSQIEILTVPAKRPIKPVYIRRLLAFIDKIRENNDGA